MEQYKTVLEGGTGEIVEKKSRFIATVRPVKNEEEALAFLEGMPDITVMHIQSGRTENLPAAVMMESHPAQQAGRCWM